MSFIKSLGLLSSSIKQGFQRNKVSGAGGKFLGRGVGRLAHNKTYSSKVNSSYSPVREKPVLSRSARVIPETQVRTKLLQKKTIDKPAALKLLEQQNEAKQKRLNRAIENLPSPPTTIPSGRGKSSSRLLTGQEKTKFLPASLSGLSNYINKITQTKDLVETWNALTSIALKDGMSDLHLSMLKDSFPDLLLKVSKDPVQADLIKDEHIKVIIPNMKKRIDFANKIFSNKSVSVDAQKLLDPLRRR